MSEIDWSWLQARLSEVQAMDAEAATEVLDERVAAIDERLEAEVSDISGTRQVIITANGDPEVFELVHRVVAAAPSIPGWSFVTLRPAQGSDPRA